MTKDPLRPKNAFAQAATLLSKGPKAPNRSTLGNWVSSSLRAAEVWQHEETVNHRSEKINQELREGAESLLSAIDKVHRFNADPGTTYFLPVPIVDVEHLEIKLRQIINRTQPTDWWIARSGRGKPKLSTRIVVLHVLARRMLEACGLKAATGTGASIARLGSLLCAAGGHPLTNGESTKAARIAGNDWELLLYRLLPWDPLDTPLPKYRVKINKVMIAMI